MEAAAFPPMEAEPPRNRSRNRSPAVSTTGSKLSSRYRLPHRGRRGTRSRPTPDTNRPFSRALVSRGRSRKGSRLRRVPDSRDRNRDRNRGRNLDLYRSLIPCHIRCLSLNLSLRGIRSRFLCSQSR